MSSRLSNGGCIHLIDDNLISSSDKESFCAQCFQDLFEKRVNVNIGSQNLPAYIKSKPPPVPPKPGKDKDKVKEKNHIADFALGSNLKSNSKPSLYSLQNAPSPQSQTDGFVCVSCDVPLNERTVESKGGKVYCKPCYRKVIQKLNCHHCRELIEPNSKSIIYQENPWHQNCFRCSKCKGVIGDQRFCSADRGIFCEDCYFETSGKKCVKCEQPMTTTGFMFRDQPWHRSCFTCNLCQKIMEADTEIFCKDEKPYCSPCYDELYLEKCAKCTKSLRGEVVEYQGKQYHEDCFTCDHCSMPIGASSFFPREDSVYCQTCFCIQFGKMCKRCGLTISPENAMGIVYQEEHWHRDCFNCSNCEKSLVGIPIHSTKDDNRPFCGECYDELFGKRCTACSKIISAVIGSKFITYEDRHWHTDCFNCKMCQTSLANRKFCPSGRDVLCGPCIKYRKD